MAKTQDGAAVSTASAEARKAFTIVVMPYTPEIVRVGNSTHKGLGFPYDDGLVASEAAARVLFDLANVLDGRRPNGNESDYEAALDRSLQLDDDKGLEASYLALRDLRSAMSPCSLKLTKDIKDRLQAIGFLRPTVEVGAEEPALTFQTMDKAPLLWDALYADDGAVGVDWKRFWGFRIPITHWITTDNANRTEEIHLRSSILSAINSDLEFADGEVASLESLKPLLHLHLDDLLAHRVRAEWLGTDADADQRWQTYLGQNKAWLACMLGEKIKLAIQRTEWKEDALKRIFTSPDNTPDLLHFACHCEPSDQTAFLNSLNLTVGGEPLALTAELMQRLMKRKEQWDYDDPGPLVFLNACSTAQTGVKLYRPPAFPQVWIDSQGALALVATLCPVPDYFAHTFAKKFYEFLFDFSTPRHQYVAEALLATRLHFMQNYNNPLGLAYVLYAVPKARIVRRTE